MEAEKYPELLRYRIRQAIAYRERVVRDADAFRVLFSEADITPGLIVDKYNDVISLQVLTQAMDAPFAREILIEELKAAYQPETILERVDPRIRELEGLAAARGSGGVFASEESQKLRPSFTSTGSHSTMKAAQDKRPERFSTSAKTMLPPSVMDVAVHWTSALTKADSHCI